MSTNKKKIWIVLLSFFALFAILVTLIVILICRENDATEYISGTKQTLADEMSGNGQIVEADKADMTIMVYIIGSDLETDDGLATNDINKFFAADLDDNINVVVQAGGAYKWNNSNMEAGSTHRFSLGDDQLNDFVNMGKVNMASQETLSDFIKFAGTNYPAEKFTLVLWNHGGDVPLQYGIDQMFPGETLTCDELKMALAEAGVHFETVVFDACLMATLEAALAVKDYADYMVAAESIIWGGLTYETWLPSLNSNPDADPETHYIKMMKSYMEFLDQVGKAGSISMLDLDKVDEVYVAYVEYVKEVGENLRDKGYDEYCKLRDGCGYYSNTDSVDIVTLASAYITDGSKDLVEAVEDAVIYSDSDYAYSHGLATYSPHQRIDKYTEGRDVLERLDYDDTILDCLDVYCSIALSYMGQEDLNKYAGEWFDLAAVQEHFEVDEPVEPGIYELVTFDKNGQMVARFTEDEIQRIRAVYSALFLKYTDTSYIVLGLESYSNYDQDGDLIIDKPTAWTTINDNFVNISLLDRYVDYEARRWEDIYGITATCNGENILIIAYYTSENPKGTILGYVNSTSIGEGEGAYIYTFDDDDVINLIHPILYTDGTTQYVKIVEEDILASNLKLGYQNIDYDKVDIVSFIKVEDIYGNAYETEPKSYE